MLDESIIEKANNLYTRVVDELGIDDFQIGNFEDVDCPISNVVEPTGFLPQWMLKADEISMTLFNTRIWDVRYISTSDSLCEIIPSLPEATDGVFDPASYDQYPIDNDIKPGLVYLIAKLSVVESLDINFSEKTCKLKPLIGRYLFSEPVNNLKLINLPSPAQLSIQNFGNFLATIRPTLQRFIPAPKVDIKPSEPSSRGASPDAG